MITLRLCVLPLGVRPGSRGAANHCGNSRGCHKETQGLHHIHGAEPAQDQSCDRGWREFDQPE